MINENADKDYLFRQNIAAEIEEFRRIEKGLIKN